jgi:hypothetical protein
MFQLFDGTWYNGNILFYGGVYQRQRPDHQIAAVGQNFQDGGFSSPELELPSLHVPLEALDL